MKCNWWEDRLRDRGMKEKDSPWDNVWISEEIQAVAVETVFSMKWTTKTSTCSEPTNEEGPTSLHWEILAMPTISTVFSFNLVTVTRQEILSGTAYSQDKDPFQTTHRTSHRTLSAGRTQMMRRTSTFRMAYRMKFKIKTKNKCHSTMTIMMRTKTMDRMMMRRKMRWKITRFSRVKGRTSSTFWDWIKVDKFKSTTLACWMTIFCPITTSISSFRMISWLSRWEILFKTRRTKIKMIDKIPHPNNRTRTKITPAACPDFRFIYLFEFQILSWFSFKI